MRVMGIEGLLASVVLLIMPFVILAVLVRVLPTKRLEEPTGGPGAPGAGPGTLHPAVGAPGA